MSTVFKALSDPTRRRVLELLRDGPMSAGDLSASFAFSKPTMSAHFTVLKNADLVRAERRGRQVVYHLNVSVLEDALISVASRFGLPMGRPVTGTPKPASN